MSRSGSAPRSSISERIHSLDALLSPSLSPLATNRMRQWNGSIESASAAKRRKQENGPLYTLCSMCDQCTGQTVWYSKEEEEEEEEASFGNG